MGHIAAGAVPGLVKIAGPAFGFCGVCGDCCERTIFDGRVGLGAVVYSHYRMFGSDHQPPGKSSCVGVFPSW